MYLSSKIYQKEEKTKIVRGIKVWEEIDRWEDTTGEIHPIIDLFSYIKHGRNLV